MKPISIEKRELIIEAKQRKETDKNIALWLGVSESSITLIWRLYKNTGSIAIPFDIDTLLRRKRLEPWRFSPLRLSSQKWNCFIEPKPYPSATPVFTESMQSDVLELLKRKPDVTLEEIITELCLPIKKSRLSKWLIDAGYPYKKNAFCNRTIKRRYTTRA